MKISRFCDQLIFIALIILVSALPLFFDIRLYSVFDLGKVAVMVFPVLFIMGLWLVKTIFKEKFAFPHTPLNLPILAFIIITIIATIFSINPIISLIGTYKRFEGLIEISTYIFIFFAFAAFINTRRKLNVIINAIVITAVATSIYGFIQYFGKDPFKWSSSTPERIFSTFGNPVFYAAFLLTSLPLSLALYLDYQPSTKNKGSSHSIQLLKDILYGICTLLIYTIFWHTRTRADFLGLIVLLPVFFVFLGRQRIYEKKWKLLIMFVLFIIIGGFYGIRPQSSVFSYFASEIAFNDKNGNEINAINKDSNSRTNLKVDKDSQPNDRSFLVSKLSGSSLNRYYQFKTGLKIYNDYPILGIGPDSLGIVYQSYLDKVFKRRKEDAFSWPRHDKIHNDVLDNVVAKGAIGLVSYMWVLLAYFLMVWKFLKQERADQETQRTKLTNKQLIDNSMSIVDRRLLVVSLGSAILGYLIQNEFSFGNTVIVTIFWTIIALTVVVIQRNELFTDNKELGYKNVKLKRPTNNTRPLSTRKVLLLSLVLSLITFLYVNVVRWYKADVYMEQGRRYTSRNDFENGLKYYEYAISYNPYEVNYRDMLNNALFKVASVTKEKVWLENIITVSNKNLEIIPTHFSGFFAISNAYYLLAQNYGEQTIDLAIENYKKTIAIDPFQPQLYNYLAMSYFKKGMYDESIEAMKKAIIMASDDLAYIDKLARIYLQLEKVDELEKLFNEIPETVIPNASLHKVKGFFLVKKGKEEEAYSEFVKALNLNNSDTEALKNIITLGLKLKKTEETIKYLKFATELKPNNIEYKMKLGTLYAQIGMLNESIEQFYQTMQIDKSKQVICLDKLGKIYMAQNDLDNALSCFVKAIEINPSDPDLYNNLGAIYAQKNMHNEAVKEIKKALKIQPDNVTFLENIVKIYFIQEKFEETETFLKRIIELDANNQEALKLLEKVKQKEIKN